AWLYGAHGPNFVRTMIKLEHQRPTVDVVDDQHGQPTWTVDVGRQIIALIHSTAAPGVYHATSSGQTTWFGLAREIFGLLGADPARGRPIPSRGVSRPGAGRAARRGGAAAAAAAPPRLQRAWSRRLGRDPGTSRAAHRRVADGAASRP